MRWVEQPARTAKITHPTFLADDVKERDHSENTHISIGSNGVNL
jgi:hypothetical protein